MVFAEADSVGTANNLGGMQHVAWGLPLTALAGLGGAIATFALARSINQH